MRKITVLKKINSIRMRQNNEKVVLDSIRFNEGISRKDLAERIGLTPATITNIVNNLKEKGYIREVGENASVGGGRRTVRLSINGSACCVVGIELAASKITCVLTDFRAKMLCSKVVEIDQNAETEIIINQMTDAMDKVIMEAGITRDQIRGIGVSTPGPCDVKEGVMINPPNLVAFRNYPIKKVMEERTGLPVIYEHHTVAAGFCEVWLGKAKTSKCMVLCSVLDIGIACSIFINGKVHHGFHNTSGEIGHMIIDRNGQKCTCGNYGCLEPMADARALVNQVKSRLKADPKLCREYGIDDVDEIDLDYVIDHEQEDVFREEIIRCAQYVGIALCNVIMILSPDTIVLAGDISDRSMLYVEEIKNFVKQRAYPRHSSDIQIYSTEYKGHVGALGGVALVLDAISTGI